MTCIAGCTQGNHVFIGGDSAGSNRHQIHTRSDAKIFKNKKMLFGFTSSFRMGQLLRHVLIIPDHPESMKTITYLHTKFLPAVISCLQDNLYANVKDNEITGGTFLLGYQGKLYTIYDDFQISESADCFSAVGCGESYAYGAWHATRNTSMSGTHRITMVQTMET